MSEKFIGFTNDLAFKKVFGSNPDILLKFLNSFLTRKLTKITVVNGDTPIDRLGEKEVFLDLLVQDEDGTLVNIEMQVRKEAFYKERSLYYFSGKYGAQLNEGDPYSKLKPVLCVNILDFKLDVNGDRQQCDSIFQLKRDDGKLVSSHIEMYYIELPKVKEDTRTGEFMEWVRLLNVRSKEELDMFRGVVEETNLAAQELSRLLTDPAERMLLEEREKGIRDFISGMKQAKREGWAETVKLLSESGMSVEEIAMRLKKDIKIIKGLLDEVE